MAEDPQEYTFKPAPEDTQEEQSPPDSNPVEDAAN